MQQSPNTINRLTPSVLFLVMNKSAPPRSLLVVSPKKPANKTLRNTSRNSAVSSMQPS